MTLRPMLTPAMKPALRLTMPQPHDPNADPVQVASNLAARAHVNHKRKVTGLPYIVHPYRVAQLVALYGGNRMLIAAAWAHDVIEDGDDMARAEARATLRPDVLTLVLELTKQEIAPGKRVKGELFLAELRRMSNAAALVKLCDRIDNLNDGIDSMPLDWLATYLDETRQLAEILNRRGLEPAYDHLLDTIAEAERRLAQKA